MKNDEIVHFVNGEDCMGNSEKYWQKTLICLDGTYVTGTGDTSVEAENRAELNRIKHEEFLLKSSIEQLRCLINQKDDLLSTDMNRAIKLIGKILLNERIK